MKGSAFVKMFRMAWNAFIGRWNQEYFDSFDYFQIQYVFGGYDCIPEYCTRNQLERVVDAIISKCIYLYLVCIESNKKSWFDFEFCDLYDGAQISIRAGECIIRISIEPRKELPR